MRRLAIGFTTTLLALTWSLAAWADISSARVVFLRGVVTATDTATSTPRVLRRNSRLEPGETIKTGPKALVQVVFPDKSLLYVKADSEVSLEQYRFNPSKPAEDKSVLKISKGAMRILTGTIGKRSPSAVQVKTRAATIGVRGTAFEVAQTGKGFVKSSGKSRNIGTGLVANTPDGGIPGTPGPLTRAANDPAPLAGKLNDSNPTLIPKTLAQVCDSLDEDAAILLVGMQSQAPKASPDAIASAVGGLSNCLSLEGSARTMTAGTVLYPDLGPGMLRASVDQGYPVDLALESIMRGLENPSQNQLKDVFDSAVDKGISLVQAQRILRSIEDRGICR